MVDSGAADWCASAARGSTAAPLGGVDGLWTMRLMKENEREMPNGTEAL